MFEGRVCRECEYSFSLPSEASFAVLVWGGRGHRYVRCPVSLGREGFRPNMIISLLFATTGLTLRITQSGGSEPP